ncbi:ABC transporter substrate-binding protein [Celerinatantimonas yamalensis]|uniref:ABC transporter substrate-binding protein n=1 Tax=Celerinatantimonas yamalensis TaxID=559956 RepID=A0ABW9G7J7_9GAMM
MNRSLKTSLMAITALFGGANLAHATPTNLPALIQAAQQEGSLTIYASTGKIVTQAKNFSKKYSIHAIGVKAKAPQIIEIMSREAKAHNVRTDVALVEDTPAAIVQLIGSGAAMSYLPAGLKHDIAKRYQNPLAVVLAPNIISYNTAHHRHCPITNIWQLTLPQWRGHIAMQDPTAKPAYTDWFNQMATHYDAQMRQAYRQQFGKALPANSSSATALFVKRLAANHPLLTHSDTDAAAAIGSPDAKQDFVGIISSAKFRKNKDGMKLGICNGLKPFIGWNYPTLGLIASGTHHLAAAKLFIHYVLTQQGIAPQSVDGKMSTNQQVKLPANEASGIGKYRHQLMVFDINTAKSDWQHRQDWQDLWNLSYMQ